MSQHLLIILFTSGLVPFCSCGNYEYHLINMKKDWETAQQYCRENYVDLATISNTEDTQQVAAVVEAAGVNSEIWIGLRETGPASWLWSTSTSQGVENYTNWAESPAPTHHCGGMRSDGKWLSVLCTTTLPFVCQGDEASRELYVVLQNSTWRQAQDYCRQHHQDLASAGTEEQNQALLQMLNQSGSPSLAWMGLFKDEWKWSDQSNASFRYWSSSQPNNDGNCALYTRYSKTWYDRGCTYAHPFLCYTAIPQTVWTVRMKIESHTLIDLNDPTVTEAMLTQFQSKLEGVKLQWRVQPDGKIFHKEEAECDSSSCNNVP
ncbi:macrophage mannose receptor 1-like [Solea solea]|uniref:macrophage mannose receptor 1-like n=1 Tax=Solea solea TaxID=90069 RepID=UPI00272D8078|nr:macrophage mannose receptor 1-like [Solea solea]